MRQLRPDELGGRKPSGACDGSPPRYDRPAGTQASWASGFSLGKLFDRKPEEVPFGKSRRAVR
jgi:hypothetical protein